MTIVGASVAPLTRQLAEFVADLSYARVPAASRGVVGSGFCDCVAVALAAKNEPAVRILRQVALSPHDAPQARVLLSATRARYADAALINGTAAHAFDYDDIGLGAHPAHPSAVLVPALMALADGGSYSGRQILTAYVAGYEVWGELALRDADQHHTKGWHPTGAFGPLAAAAASANLLQLDAGRTAHALAIAASRASGIVSNFGSMTKPLHAGQSAQAGVFAAQLAAAGFTGCVQALEHDRGLLRALSPRGEVDLASPARLGVRWHSVNMPLGFKQYPVCYAMHRAIDAAVELGGRLPEGALGRIDRINAWIGADQAKLLNYHDPRDVLQAKFSLEFGISAALLTGRLGLSELREDFICSEPVRALMHKVHITLTEEHDPVYRLFSPHDRVEIVTDGGQRWHKDVAVALGHPTRPPSIEQQWEKFSDCVRGAFDAAQSRQCFDALLHIEYLPATSALPVASS